MQENGLNLEQCLLGSAVGWLTALVISAVIHWLRCVIPRPTAFPGMGIACLWILSDFVFLLLAASYRDSDWVQTALLTSVPLLGCLAVAWWHQETRGIPRTTAFGILVVEFVTALIVWSCLEGTCRALSLSLFGTESGGSRLYGSVLPVLLLTLLVEEIAGPVRRRVRKEFAP